MNLTLKPILRVAPKPVSNEIFHHRTGDILEYGVISFAGVMLLAEVILAWPH
jgi:hypothetical protein